MNNVKQRFQLKKIEVNIFPWMTLVSTYAYQQHIIWNLFNKCMNIDVQTKYENVNDDDLHCQSTS